MFIIRVLSWTLSDGLFCQTETVQRWVRGWESRRMSSIRGPGLISPSVTASSDWRSMAETSRWWWHWRIKAQDKQDYFNWCCHQDATVEIKFCDLKICFRFEFDVWHMLVMNLNLISYCVQNTINDQFLLLKCLSTSMNFLWSMCRMFVVWILCWCLNCYRVYSWELVNIAADNCDNSCSSEHDSHNAY